MRQLSADSITPSSHVNDVSSPSGSHVSPAIHKSSNESTKRSSQSQQKQLGNLVSDINALALDNNSSQSKASQPQQQQPRSNQTTAGNPVISGGTGNTNGNGNCIQTSTNSPSSNMVWQQTSPNATNGSVKLISTDNTAGKNKFVNFFSTMKIENR